MRLPPFSILLQGRGLIPDFLPSIFPGCPWKQFLCSSEIHVSSRPLLGAENTPFPHLVEGSPICGYQYSNNPPPLLLVLSWCGKSSGLQATHSYMVNQYSAGTQTETSFRLQGHVTAVALCLTFLHQMYV